MRSYSGSVANPATGRPLIGAQIRVLNNSDGTLATIFADESATPLDNPFTVQDAGTSAPGYFKFFADNGFYDIEYIYRGSTIFIDSKVDISVDLTAAAIEAPEGAGLVGKTGGGTVQDYIDDLGTAGASTGAAMAAFLQTEASAIALSVQAKLRQELDAADFGATGDGATDDTAALAAWFAALQVSGKPGRIREGRYVCEPGSLEWTFTATAAGQIVPGPVIRTSGDVTLVAKPGSTADAPFLYIHNDPNWGPGDGTGAYIDGGYVGPLIFEDERGGALTDTHGLQVYGVQNMTFGLMRTNGEAGTSRLQGDVIHIERQGDASTGDHWHVYNCRWGGARNFYGDGWAFYNDSISQVFSGNTIGCADGYGNAMGAFFGVGTNNRVLHISAVGCGAGLTNGEGAIDLVSTSGTQANFKLHSAEIDAVQCVAIRLCGINQADIQARIIYRRPGSTTFPTKGVVLEDLENGGSAQNVTLSRLRIIHRVSTGQGINDGNLGNLLEVVDGDTDAIIADNVIEHSPSSDFTITPSKYYSGISQLVSLKQRNLVLVSGVPVYDRLSRNSLLARATTGGIGTSFVALVFDSAAVNDGNAYDNTTGAWTCPADGIYRFTIQVTIAPDADGDEVELGLATSAGVRVACSTFQANGTDVQTFTFSGIWPLDRGTVYQFRGRHGGSGTNNFAFGTSGSAILTSNFVALEMI